MAPGPAVPAAAACPGGRFEEWDSDSSGPLAVPPAIRSRTTLPPSTAWFCTYSLLEFAVLKHMAGEEVSAGCLPYTHTPPLQASHRTGRLPWLGAAVGAACPVRGAGLSEPPARRAAASCPLSPQAPTSRGLWRTAPRPTSRMSSPTDRRSRGPRTTCSSASSLVSAPPIPSTS